MATSFQLLNSLLLPDFPSGSSITFYNDKFYLIGDDAKSILVLDVDYNRLDTITLFDYPQVRIPKTEKADFETSTVVSIDRSDYLMVLGSSSRKNRRRGVIINLNAEIAKEKIYPVIDFTKFNNRLKFLGIKEVNIEGSAIVGENFLLSNRANDSNPVNHLIITSSNFWLHQEDAPVSILKIDLPTHIESVIGVSELCYVASKNLLLFTFTSEVTNNEFDDGTIGNSYIGWRRFIDVKLNDDCLELDGIVNLSDLNKIFKGEKIEGVFVESIISNVFTIHLVSDNDLGQSKLFKISIGLPNSL